MESTVVYQIMELFKDYQPYGIMVGDMSDRGEEEIDLEWYIKPSFIVSVTIDAKGIHYAYLLNEERGHNFIPLSGPLTDDLTNAIKKVLNAKD